MNAGQFELILPLLTEIRDRMPPPAPPVTTVIDTPHGTFKAANNYAYVRVRSDGVRGELECTAIGCRWHTILVDDSAVWYPLDALLTAAAHSCPSGAS